MTHPTNQKMRDEPGGVAQVGQHMLCRLKALSSNLGQTKKKKKKKEVGDEG
jgi:hypothetical protein